MAASNYRNPFTTAAALLLLHGLSSAVQAQRESSTALEPPLGQPGAQKEDPFTGLTEAPKAQEAPKELERSWSQRFFKENFGFRKEIMSQFDTNQDGNLASRQSVGFEVLKKFSTATRTVASFDFQGRLVRRDGFNPVQNDMEGATRPGWAFEYHNLYLDLYDVLNPFLSDERKGQAVGRFNFRAGRFYVPFGLNLQTDTHGTVLQLSNERSFGFERDWYTGFWGALNKHLNYDLYYLVGSGYDLAYKGQTGLGALRLSLSNRYSSEYGLEGGFSILGGERLPSDTSEQNSQTTTGSTGMRNPSLSQPFARALRAATVRERVSEAVPQQVFTSRPIQTERVGIDARYRRPASKGLLTFTTELSGGRDNHDPVFMQLHQADYLHSSRRWGIAAQYRQFRQEGLSTDASIIGEFTWYFRNDVGNSNLHWVKLNVEQRIERMPGSPTTVVTLQYYFYR